MNNKGRWIQIFVSEEQFRKLQERRNQSFGSVTLPVVNKNLIRFSDGRELTERRKGDENGK